MITTLKRVWRRCLGALSENIVAYCFRHKRGGLPVPKRLVYSVLFDPSSLNWVLIYEQGGVAREHVGLKGTEEALTILKRVAGPRTELRQLTYQELQQRFRPFGGRIWFLMQGWQCLERSLSRCFAPFVR